MCGKSVLNQASKQAGIFIHALWSGTSSRGTAIYQIEGEGAQTLPAGSAFYEPAETVIANFGSKSNSVPMTFIALYLLDGEQDLTKMLDSNWRKHVIWSSSSKSTSGTA
jgi:hypothetical protein